jgi:sugar lactone lactonase YvrE
MNQKPNLWHLQSWLLALALGILPALVGCHCCCGTPKRPATQTSRLFVQLPDFCPTPDGMAIAPDGDLVVACPNYADQSKKACLIKISRDGKVRKWIEVPTLAATGVACPMGIEFGPDGDLYVCDNQGWMGTPAGQSKGRVLRLRIKNDQVEFCQVVAEGMEHPNGVRVWKGGVYVTESLMPKVKDPSGLLVSGVYRFRLDDRNVQVNNTLEDPNLITTFVTRNKECQYGADGLAFDRAGQLYVGNFGDGAIHKVTFGPDGKVAKNAVWAVEGKELRTTDGICFDPKGNLYVADFSENAVAAVTPKAQVYRLARSPDSNGSRGELDQPGEPIVWNGKLIVTCFDKVTGPDKVNTKHDWPYTIVELDLVR